MDINQYISSGIIEMYVMGLCSDEEKAALEVMRPQYAELDTAISAFEKTFEKNLLQNVTMPGGEIDAKILSSFNSLQTPVIDIATSINLQPKIRKINWYKLMAAASVILLVVSGFFNYSFYKKMNSQELALNQKGLYSPLPLSDYEVLKQPNITPIAMYGVDPYIKCRCTMFWDKNSGKVYVMIHHLIPSSSGTNYQLWAMVNKKPVSVGIMDDSIRDRFIEMQNMPGGATDFIVTLEKKGGGSSPSEETVLSGRI